MRQAECDLCSKQVQHVASALLAADGQAPDDGASGEDGSGAERQRLQDIRAAPDAAVEQDLQTPVHHLGDLRQCVERRRDAAELATAVVGGNAARRSRSRLPAAEK